MIITENSYFKFSGGEVHCEITELPAPITMKDYTMNGFMALAEYVEILRRNGHKTIDVTYPYLPYARQDRAMKQYEPFSLKVFCNLLNSLKLDKVRLVDPHSDVAPALINNCGVIHQWEVARRTIPKDYLEDPSVIFVSPDAGAYKKLYKLITDDSRIAIGLKYRDDKGDIQGTKVFSSASLENRTCVIVDDICDGGRTFIELAKALRAQGATRIILYITHGIFSKGFGELDTYINHIYTTNSFPNKAPSKLVTVRDIFA